MGPVVSRSCENSVEVELGATLVVDHKGRSGSSGGIVLRYGRWVTAESISVDE